MYTKKEIAKLQAALNRVRKCNGDCKHCEKCHVYTSKNCICYAFGCDLLPTDMFDMISDRLADMKKQAIEILEFELS